MLHQKEDTTTNSTDDTNTSNTPITVCYNGLSNSQESNGLWEHFDNHRSFYQVCSSLSSREPKGINYCKVSSWFHEMMWLSRPVSFWSGEELCGQGYAESIEVSQNKVITNNSIPSNGQWVVWEVQPNIVGHVRDINNWKRKTWLRYIADLVLAYDSATHESLGYSPYFMMFGQQPRLLMLLWKNTWNTCVDLSFCCISFNPIVVKILVSTISFIYGTECFQHPRA